MPEIILHSPSKKNPARVVPTTERLLASVDPKYLIGLGQVTLTNVADLPASRKRKYWTSRRYFRGAYWRPYRGQKARIELYLDAIAESNFASAYRWPVLCDFVIGQTLFHEIGHHINLHVKREHKDAELAADEWKDRLMRSYLRDLWCFRGLRRRWLAKRIFGFLKRFSSKEAQAA